MARPRPPYFQVVVYKTSIKTSIVRRRMATARVYRTLLVSESSDAQSPPRVPFYGKTRLELNRNFLVILVGKPALQLFLQPLFNGRGIWIYKNLEVF